MMARRARRRPVNITVTTATNQLPTVSITSPIAGQSFTAPASLTITAAASDSDGTISGVDFYVGTQLVGTDTSSPYTAAWSNVAAGSYSLTAVARDNSGGTRTSTAIAVTVTAVAPTPTRVVFVPSADHTTNVTSYTVALYRSADPITGEPGRDARPRQADARQRRNLGRHLDAGQSAAGRLVQGRGARVRPRRHDGEHAVGSVHEVERAQAQGSGRSLERRLSRRFCVSPGP